MIISGVNRSIDKSYIKHIIFIQKKNRNFDKF